MMTERKYAIWFMPEGETYDLLKHEIATLSDEFSSPLFDPHITLIGGIIGPEDVLISKTGGLAQTVHPSSVTLQTIDHLDEYYRCLFLRVGETQGMFDANVHARGLFNRTGDDRFMPHLSLMYGELSRRSKEEIVGRIGNRLRINFVVDAVHLFSTAGEPEDWYRVKAFPLKRTGEE